MKKGIIACVVAVIVAWGGCQLFPLRSFLERHVYLTWYVWDMLGLAAMPFSFVLSRHAPEGTGGEIGLVTGNRGVSRVADPLAMGLRRVNWLTYTDEKGVQRRGPVATLAMWREDKPLADKLKHFEGMDVDVHAGQHLQWDIFSLYIEEVSYFPEFVHFRVYKSSPAESGS